MRTLLFALLACYLGFLAWVFIPSKNSTTPNGINNGLPDRAPAAKVDRTEASVSAPSENLNTALSRKQFVQLEELSHAITEKPVAVVDESKLDWQKEALKGLAGAFPTGIIILMIQVFFFSEEKKPLQLTEYRIGNFILYRRSSEFISSSKSFGPELKSSNTKFLLFHRNVSYINVNSERPKKNQNHLHAAKERSQERRQSPQGKVS